MKIILASGSPRRKQLLEQINLDFEVQASNASEAYEPDQPPRDVVRELALRKAREIAALHTGRNRLIIGADTIVVHKNRILEKPADRQDAEKMLASLSSTRHQVLTGVALVKSYAGGNKTETSTFVEETEVIFGDVQDTEITEYVQTGSPMDKAGGYGIQDHWGSIFVKRIIGDYYNVVGFPLHAFYRELKTFAPEAIPLSLNNRVI